MRFIMSFSIVQRYFNTSLSHVPWTHLVVIGIISLAVAFFLSIRKKCPVYRAIVLGVTVFIGLFIMDLAVWIRYCGFFYHASGNGLQVGIGRLFHESDYFRVEVIANMAVFVPFGSFLSGIISSTGRFGAWRRIGIVILSAFGLSLLIEALQLILHVGFFELMDLMMNTLGGFLGAAVAIMGRKLIGLEKK